MVGRGFGGRRRDLKHRGEMKLGKKAVWLASPGACTGWAWEGQWLEGWMWCLGGAMGASPTLGGTWGGNSGLSCFGELQVDA